MDVILFVLSLSLSLSLYFTTWLHVNLCYICHSVYNFIGCPLISIFFLFNCLRRDVDEAKAEEFNEMACKASLVDQQKQVRENINAQIKSFSTCIDEILLPYTKRIGEAQELPPHPIAASC